MRCDLHRHMGGAIKPSVIYEILQKQKKHAYFSVEEVASDLQFAQNEPYTFQGFLRKFDVLDTIIWDEWAISRSINQICYDLKRENIDYSEIKFSIDKYVRHTNWPERDVIKLVKECFEKESSKWGIMVGLVLSLKYESDRKRQKDIAMTITDPEVVDLVDGIDLVGDETYFDADFYAPIFKEWKQAGKGLQAHVGETCSEENVKQAIEKLGVTRIAHGVRAVNHPDILKMANERNIPFDIALTSNLYTGVVKSLKEHPVVKMIEQGCQITIGTDDPVILNTTLDKEYRILMDVLGVNENTVIDIMENSVKHAFKKVS